MLVSNKKGKKKRLCHSTNPIIHSQGDPNWLPERICLKDYK
jgi:hypothetical protein